MCNSGNDCPLDTDTESQHVRMDMVVLWEIIYFHKSVSQNGNDVAHEFVKIGSQHIIHEGGRVVIIFWELDGGSCLSNGWRQFCAHQS